MAIRVKDPQYSGSDALPVFDETKQWANINGQYLVRPIRGGDGRVFIKEDPYKSQYECTECNGTGHTSVVCKYCKGTKWDNGIEEKGYCRDCTVGEGTTGKLSGKTLGFELCTKCRGAGGIIDVPDESKRNTTTGDILAVSREFINEVKVGDKVMFTNYTGSPFKFLGIDFRVCQEKDLLLLVKQLKKNVGGLSEGTYADLDNTGMAHE